MVKSLLSFMIPFILLSNGLLSARERVIRQEYIDVTSYPQFKQAMNIKLNLVCEKTIMAAFGDWYDGWVVNRVVTDMYIPPTEINKVITEEVQSHIDLLQNHLQEFLKRQTILRQYANVYFEVEVADLLSRVNHLLSNEFVNRFDDHRIIKELSQTMGPHIGKFVDEIANQELTFEMISNIGKMFFAEYYPNKKKANPELNLILDSLTRELINGLLLTLDVFANIPNSQAYDDLQTSENRALIQHFYDTFYPLLDPAEIKITVLQRLTGEESKMVKQSPFFTFDFYTLMTKNPSIYEPLFLRDRFITMYRPGFKLESLHKAATKEYFSWDFLTLFDVVDFDTIMKNKSKDPVPKADRKRARMYQILYSIYSFARIDGTLNPKVNIDKVSILKKLFDWVLETKEFDEPEQIEDAVVTPGKELHQVIPRDRFKRYFLPVLQLICNNIPDCKMGTNERKPDIIKRFVDFGNYEELNQKKAITDLIDPEIYEAISHEASISELKDFADEIDLIIDENPLDEEDTLPIDMIDESPQKLGNVKPASEICQRKEKSLPKLGLPPKVEKQFQEKITKKFFPSSNLDEPQKLKKLTSFIDTIEGTDDLKKKNLLRNLLIKFIYKTSVEEGADKPIVGYTITHTVTRLRSKIDYEKLAGLKNFFFRTMNLDLGRFHPAHEDLFTYSMDIIFLIFFAAKDRMMTIYKDKSKKAEVEQLKETIKNLNMIFFKTGSKSLDGLRASMAKNEFKTQPMFLEKSVGLEYFIEFIDFFNYYRVIDEDSQAVNVAYYRVYVQFYEFLSHLRRLITTTVENPHLYTLERLEDCLTYTETHQQWDDSSSGHPFCHFSHRKYAEMLFFYKTYLIATEKPVQLARVSQSYYDANSHVRLFLVFTTHNTEYQRVMTSGCSAYPNDALCISWTIFNKVNEYLRNPRMNTTHLEKIITKLNKQESVHTRINILNGLEATYLYNTQSSMIDWEKFNNILNLNRLHKHSPIHQLLVFQKGDTNEFANYLARSYKKITFSNDESNLVSIIQAILNGPVSQDPNQDSLKKMLYFNGEIVPLFVKVFLQFALTDKQYQRIANVLIENNLSVDLIKLNDIQKDNLYKSFVDMTKYIPKEQVATLGTETVYKALISEYEKLFKVCNAVTIGGLSKQVNENMDEEFDPEDFFSELEGEMEVTIETEEKAFKQEVLPKVVEGFHQIQFDESQDVEAMKKKLGEMVSRMDPNIKVEFEVEEIERINEDDVEIPVSIETSKRIERVEVKEQQVDFVLQHSNQKIDEVAEKVVQNIAAKIHSIHQNPNESMPAKKNLSLNVPTILKSFQGTNKDQVSKEQLLKELGINMKQAFVKDGKFKDMKRNFPPNKKQFTNNPKQQALKKLLV